MTTADAIQFAILMVMGLAAFLAWRQQERLSTRQDELQRRIVDIEEGRREGEVVASKAAVLSVEVIHRSRPGLNTDDPVLRIANRGQARARQVSMIASPGGDGTGRMPKILDAGMFPVDMPTGHVLTVDVVLYMGCTTTLLIDLEWDDDRGHQAETYPVLL